MPPDGTARKRSKSPGRARKASPASAARVSSSHLDETPPITPAKDKKTKKKKKKKAKTREKTTAATTTPSDGSVLKPGSDAEPADLTDRDTGDKANHDSEVSVAPADLTDRDTGDKANHDSEVSVAAEVLVTTCESDHNDSDAHDNDDDSEAASNDGSIEDPDDVWKITHEEQGMAMLRQRPAPAPTDACVAIADLVRCRCLGGAARRPGRLKMAPQGMPRHLLQGITVDGMREYLEGLGLLTKADAREGGRAAASGRKTGYDAQAHANHASALDGLSICERISRSLFSSRHVGFANVYVCWPLSASLSDLVDALESFVSRPAEPGGASPTFHRRDTYFWVCTFSLRQHAPQLGMALSHAPSLEHTAYLEGVGLIIELIEHVVVLLDRWVAPALLGRAHCLREIALSHERGARLDLIMGTRAGGAFDAAFSQGFDPLCSLLDTIASIDIWEAECVDPRDKQYLLHEATTHGYAPGLTLGPPTAERLAGRGRPAVNQQLRVLLRGALVRFGRAEAARLPFAERCASRTVNRLGALTKEVEVRGLREKLGSEHATTLSAINALAGLHKANGDLARSEALYKECLQARRTLLGNTDPLTLLSANNLGTVMFAQGDQQGAVALLGEAVASRRRELGALAPATLNSLSNLGNVHRAMGDNVKAVGMLEQALEGRRMAIGSKHIDTLRSMGHLASALYDKGLHEPAEVRKADLDQALSLYREALEGCRCSPFLGDSHPLTLGIMNNLGNLLHARALLQPKFIPGRGPNAKREEELQRGIKLLREALEQSKLVHGPRHVEALISASNLGSALRSLSSMHGNQHDPYLSEEASGLIREAVEGITGAWADLKTLPRARTTLLEGLEQLDDEGRAAAKQLSA